MDWNEDAISRLRDLWAEGHSTAEIGRRMGVTKNAVVGKAHRLNLSPRPSPIRRSDAPDHVPRREQAKRVTGPTLPTLDEPRAPAATRAPLRSVAAPAPARGVRVSSCCWPIGDPGTPTFRFCDDGALPNKPYCAAHAALAYVKVRDRREDAA